MMFEQPDYQPPDFTAGIAPRVFDEKRSVAAAEFDLERLRFRKIFRQVQRLDDGKQWDDQIFWRVGLSFQIGQLKIEVERWSGR